MHKVLVFSTQSFLHHTSKRGSIPQNKIICTIVSLLPQYSQYKGYKEYVKENEHPTLKVEDQMMEVPPTSKSQFPKIYHKGKESMERKGKERTKKDRSPYY